MSQFVETCTVCDGSGKACDHAFHALGKDRNHTLQCPSCGRTDAPVCDSCEGSGEVWIDDPIRPD